MARIPSIFIGHFFEALQAIHAHTDLAAVIGEKGEISESIKAFCMENNLPLTIVENSDELTFFFQKRPELHGRTLFSAGCGILFSQKVIDSCSLVVNFHPGDIFTCRGKHPLPFAILKKLPLMAMTAHVIDSEKIDAGPLIAQIFLPIDYTASYAANEKTLLDSLSGFVTSVIALLVRGTFRAWDWYGVSPSPYNTRLDPAALARILSSDVIGAL